MIERGLTAAYFQSLRKKRALLLVLILLILIVAVYAIVQGAYEISIKEVLLALTGQSEGPNRVVVTSIRLPRVAASIVCGVCLSLSGLCLQSVLKNPLASPMTLGINHGAACGAALSIVFFGSRVFSTTAFAFIGAMSATMVILVLGRLKRLSAEAIILAGVAMSSFFLSATTLIQYLASETELAMVVFWTFGDVARSSWKEIGLTAVAAFPALVLLYIFRWDLNSMASGEETAKGLGVNVERLRLGGLIGAALVAALATAFHGNINFLGLIAPHIAKRMVGEDHGILIPVTVAVGALLMLTADTAGKAVVGSGALPVGVITSFLGAPMFIYLLVKGYK